MMAMKTPFNRYKTAAALAAAVAFLPVSHAASANEEDVFAGNKEVILSTNVVSTGGNVFCVGRALSEDRLGASIGFGKARLLAWMQFDHWCFATAPWPADATEEERRLVVATWPKSEHSIQGASVVFETRPKAGRWLVVLAVPEKEAVAARPPQDALADALNAVRARRRDAEEKGAQKQDDSVIASEPRGPWEEGEITANETMAEGQF